MTVPGITFHSLGGTIKQILDAPKTEALLIIGTALDGPKNRPIRVTNATQVEKVFGPPVYKDGYIDPTTGTESGKRAGATIPLAVNQALSVGASNIYVVRATGNYAVANDAFGGKIDFQSIYPGRVYNGITITLAFNGGNAELTVDQPEVKGVPFTIIAPTSTTILEFIELINNDPRNKSVYADPTSHTDVQGDTLVTLTAGSVILTGGTNGTKAPGEDFATSLNGYAQALAGNNGTFDLLEDFRFAVAVLTGIHIDDQVVDGANETTTSIVIDFADWLERVSLTTRPCFGVIGTRPTNLRSQEDVINHINTNLMDEAAGWVDQNARWIKAGFFASRGVFRTDPIAGAVNAYRRVACVAGPDVVFSNADVGTYNDNWHVMYAALLTTIPPEQSPILRPIPGIKALGPVIPRRYAEIISQGIGYQEDSTDSINGKGAYVILVKNPNDPFGPPVVYEDPTLDYRNSIYRQWHVIHLVNNIHVDLARELSTFLGQPIGAPLIAAMNSAARNILDGYADSGALRGGPGEGYDFRIQADGPEASLGAVKVHLEIVPAVTLRSIRFVVAVRNS